VKRLAQITLTAGVTLLVFVLLWVFQPTLAMFGGSLAISAALRPLVQRLESRGLKRGVAILIWYLLILAALAVGALLYGVGVAGEVGSAIELLPQAYTSLVDRWQHGAALQQALSRGLPRFDELFRRIQVLPDGPERLALLQEAIKISLAFMPLKCVVHRIITDLTQPWLTRFRRPLYGNRFWQYIDIDAARQPRPR